MNDFSQVVQWIFAQLNAVLNLISQYYILRIALFVPIAGAAMIAVFYLLQHNDMNLLIFKMDRGVGFKSYAFGSVYSNSLIKNNLSARSIGRYFVVKNRKKKADNERELEKQRLRDQRESEKQMYKLHETIYFDEDGNMIKSQSYHRNTLAPHMSEFEKHVKPISKVQAQKLSKAKSEKGAISRKPTYDLDSIKERIMNNTEI